MPRQQQADAPRPFFDLKGNFNAGYRITEFGVALVRPIFLSGQGIRAYGMESLFAFCALPVLASYTHSYAIQLYWYAWCLMLIFRRLTPDRSQHTLYWGRNRLVRWLTLGLLGHSAERYLEPLLIAGIAWLASSHSLPLSRLLYFGAFSYVMQYRLAVEMDKRDEEAIHNARIMASRSRL
jgi:hypothetical protein